MNPKKKVRREVTVRTKVEILAHAKLHRNATTLKKYPEISASTLTRMKKKAAVLVKAVAKGNLKGKRRRGPSKYADLWKAVYDFFVEVREANGPVSRDLLESFMLTLAPGIVKDFFQITSSGRDEFWKRWRTWYGVVYRRAAGVKQYIPGDSQQRVETFKALLHSMYEQRGHRVFICADETGVRCEELPNVTMEQRGAKRVHLTSTGLDRTIFTVLLGSQMVVDKNGKVVSVTKLPPLFIYKGAKEGRIQRQVESVATQWEDCTATVSENGWMTGDIFLDWVKKTVGTTAKAILVVDLYAAHRDARVLDWLRGNNTDIVFIPEQGWYDFFHQK